MTDQEFIKAYPLSIKAWIEQREVKEFMSTGTEEVFYEDEVAEYAYWFADKKIKELEAKIKLKDEEILVCAENWSDDQRQLREAKTKLLKLKQLILLTDPVVGHVEMNELTKTQWLEFIKCFPDEGEK